MNKTPDVRVTIPMTLHSIEAGISFCYMAHISSATQHMLQSTVLKQLC